MVSNNISGALDVGLKTAISDSFGSERDFMACQPHISLQTPSSGLP